jgi:hypothetical protein
MNDIPAFGAPDQEKFSVYADGCITHPLLRKMLMSLMPALVVGPYDPARLLNDPVARQGRELLLKEAPGCLVMTPPFSQHLFIGLACPVTVIGDKDSAVVELADYGRFARLAKRVLPPFSDGLVKIGFTRLGVWDRCETIFNGLNIHKGRRPDLHRLCFPK